MNRKSIFGITLIGIAVLLSAQIMGLVPHLQFDIWRLVITLFLVAIVLDNIPKQHYFGIFMPLSLAVAYNRVYLNLGRTNFFPIILVGFLLSLGFSMVFKRRRRIFYRNNSQWKGTKNTKGASTSYDSEDTINVESSFNDYAKYVRSENFKGGYIESNFGQLQVYLHEATFDPTGAILDLDVNFGSLTIYVRRGTRTHDHISTAFGGIQMDEYMYVEGNNDMLTLKGDCNFGSVKVVAM